MKFNSIKSVYQSLSRPFSKSRSASSMVKSVILALLMVFFIYLVGSYFYSMSEGLETKKKEGLETKKKEGLETKKKEGLETKKKEPFHEGAKSKKNKNSKGKK